MKTFNLSIENYSKRRSHDFTCNINDIKKIQIIYEASSIEMSIIINDKHIFIAENVGDEFELIGELNENFK